MAARVLYGTLLREVPREWIITPRPLPPGCRVLPDRNGLRVEASRGNCVRMYGAGVHTRSGDRVQLSFRVLRGPGQVHLGFVGGFEYAHVRLEFDLKRLSVDTSEWYLDQPRHTQPLSVETSSESHRLVLLKVARGRGMVKRCDLTAWLNRKRILDLRGVNILPETGVEVTVKDAVVQLSGFCHMGQPSSVPEHFHIGCWQMPSVADVDSNLRSLERGIREAADAGVRLLLTPETSLTGLFPLHPVTLDRKSVQAAERRLQRLVVSIPGAPYTIVGLPVWDRMPDGRAARYNVSRVYAPDGSIHASCAKIHSCEAQFHHGYRYNTFKVEGVPCALIVCHDARYPDAQQVPVMFGARVILHASGAGRWAARKAPLVDVGSTDGVTSALHAFYVHTNSSGGSRIVSPDGRVLAVASELRRCKGRECSVRPREELVHAVIRVHDAFGYWPLRAMRASESAARAFRALYRAMGGTPL